MKNKKWSNFNIKQQVTGSIENIIIRLGEIRNTDEKNVKAMLNIHDADIYDNEQSSRNCLRMLQNEYDNIK